MPTNGYNRIYTAVVEYDAESKMYIGSVPSLPPVHTQAANLDELRSRLKEAIDLCLEDWDASEHESIEFIGLQQIEVER
jgi:predicted RNase H-like HicB family nuclease